MNSPRSHPRAAFTLIELLVVIAILAIMAVAGAMALGGSSGKSLKGSAAVASSIFGLARTEAIMRRIPVRVIVDADPASQNYLKRLAAIAPAMTAGNPDWSSVTQIAKWQSLPANAYFNAANSTQNTMTGGGLPGTSRFFYFQFEPNGQMAPFQNSNGQKVSIFQFVISPGVVNNGSFQETGTNQRYGFKVFRMGNIAFFDDPGTISPP
jgi:prepilin-type N-terminal cleavage/methylation domain-containing protein